MNGKQSVLSAGDVNLDSRCIDFLRCVLIVFVVLIHTNLVADTSCEDSVYARGYDIMGNLLWLCNPLKAAAAYLVAHQTDPLFYPIVHLANATISFSCCVLAYLIIYKISPSGCKLLGARI